MADLYCNLCGVRVDDDPDEFMIEGRCLQCDKAFQAGKETAAAALRKTLLTADEQAAALWILGKILDDGDCADWLKDSMGEDTEQAGIRARDKITRAVLSKEKT